MLWHQVNNTPACKHMVLRTKAACDPDCTWEPPVVAVRAVAAERLNTHSIGGERLLVRCQSVLPRRLICCGFCLQLCQPSSSLRVGVQRRFDMWAQKSCAV